MSSLGGLAIRGNFFRKRGDDEVGVVDAQGRLGQIGDLVGIGDLEPLDVLGGLDQDHAVGGLAHRADDLVVPFVADQDDRVPFAGVLDASRWTLVTSGQVASMARRLRRRACSRIWGETPWAL